MVNTDYTAEEVCRITHGHLVQAGKINRISDIGIDSRMFDFEPSSLFIAIRGKQKNGHDFIPELYRRGVRFFMVTELPDLSILPEATVIRVQDAVRALQALAGEHRRTSGTRIIGITGSNGKTVVKEWAYQLLFRDYHILRSPRSYNSQIGVPLSLLMLEKNHQLAVIEAGISQPGEMDILEKLIRPEIGIFTNIGDAHQNNFRSLDSKVQEKLKLFRNSEILIYCRDHTLIDAAVTRSELFSARRVLSWSFKKEADLTIHSQELAGNHTLLTGNFRGSTVRVEIPFPDAASVENSCHLWLLMLFLGFDSETINNRFATLTPVAMRLEQLAGVNGCVVINDVYNSDINSLSIALDHLLFQSKNQRYTVILSDILQSGESPENLYARVARLLRTRRIQRFIGVGEALSAQEHQFTGMETAFYKNTSAFLREASRKDFAQENILVKGARDFAFERIVDWLQEKSHETVLEIDLSRMTENLNFIRSRVQPETRIMAMVKAFGYGSGSYDIARLLEFNRVDYLAVAYADEGIALREDGIGLPVMVLNPEVSAYDAMIRYHLEPQIFSFRTLDLFTEALRQAGEVAPYPAHIKINTGMNRLGFNTDEIDALAARLTQNPVLHLKSVFSHLAGSDDPAFDAFTKNQISRFTTAADNLTRNFDYRILRHVLNSCGILRYPDAQMDMVRLGLALYGLTSCGGEQLKPVSSLKTTIAQIRTVQPGEGVGYTPKSVVAKPTKVAVISVGYADGLPRLLGNGIGRVWINGRAVPFIGNICMDMSMVDVTGVECSEGDEVEVFGRHLDIYEMAEHLHTIPYEVITNIDRRVKRVFVQD